ncbi:MAG: Type 1 glutamine amidotransferase-like domain-containing protein, partial [Acidimicrobiales bacterium]
SRADAEDPGATAVLRKARFIYLSGSSPMHLRSVLKGSKAWDALVAAWNNGAVIAGSSGSAMALTDPMVDARGGGLTLGLGLVTGIAVVPHFGDTHEDAHGQKMHRSVLLAPRGTPVAGVPERTALIRDPDGTWRTAGEGSVAIFVNGAPAEAGLGALPN